MSGVTWSMAGLDSERRSAIDTLHARIKAKHVSLARLRSQHSSPPCTQPVGTNAEMVTANLHPDKDHIIIRNAPAVGMPTTPCPTEETSTTFDVDRFRLLLEKKDKICVDRHISSWKRLCARLEGIHLKSTPKTMSSLSTLQKQQQEKAANSLPFQLRADWNWRRLKSSEYTTQTMDENQSVISDTITSSVSLGTWVVDDSSTLCSRDFAETSSTGQRHWKRVAKFCLCLAISLLVLGWFFPSLPVYWENGDVVGAIPALKVSNSSSCLRRDNRTRRLKATSASVQKQCQRRDVVSESGKARRVRPRPSLSAVGVVELNVADNLRYLNATIRESAMEFDDINSVDYYLSPLAQVLNFDDLVLPPPMQADSGAYDGGDMAAIRDGNWPIVGSPETCNVSGTATQISESTTQTFIQKDHLIVAEVQYCVAPREDPPRFHTLEGRQKSALATIRKLPLLAVRFVAQMGRRMYGMASFLWSRAL